MTISVILKDFKRSGSGTKKRFKMKNRKWNRKKDSRSGIRSGSKIQCLERYWKWNKNVLRN